MHWACKRGNERIVNVLLRNGADKSLRNFNNETCTDICTYRNINELLGGPSTTPKIGDPAAYKFVPNYLRNAPLNAQVDVAPVKIKQSEFFGMQRTVLPTASNEELVLKVRIQGSPDPDFIEIEIPKWKLTYENLLKTCCEELYISEAQVERIRKLPDTRLRKDNDVRRLTDFQALEVVLRDVGTEKSTNCYQSISSCKNQTILY